ncbi:MAG: hypothetical protein AAGH99_09275 [Planctomycetota bacterium]
MELIVVLVILAALGTVLVTQTTGLTDEARYTQTVRSLEAIQDAVIGRQVARGEDPTAVPPGFVSDMGRLPQAVEEATDVFTLAELWDGGQFAAADLYQVRTLTGLDNELQMASGWRGPYVRLPVGTDELRNGWGREFDLFDGAGAAVDANNDSIGAVSSTGSELGDAFDPATPLEVLFADSSVATAVDRSTGRVPETVTVEFPQPFSAADTSVTVRVYGIDGTDGDLIPDVLLEGTAQAIAGSTSLTLTLVDLIDPDATPGHLMGIGPKIIRAYRLAAAPTPDQDFSAEPNKSDAVSFSLPAGGLSSLPTVTLIGN